MEGVRAGWGSGWRSGANGQVRDPYIPGMMTGGGLLSCGFKLCFVRGTKLPRGGRPVRVEVQPKAGIQRTLQVILGSLALRVWPWGGATENSYGEE